MKGKFAVAIDAMSNHRRFGVRNQNLGRSKKCIRTAKLLREPSNEQHNSTGTRCYCALFSGTYLRRKLIAPSPGGPRHRPDLERLCVKQCSLFEVCFALLDQWLEETRRAGGPSERAFHPHHLTVETAAGPDLVRNRSYRYLHRNRRAGAYFSPHHKQRAPSADVQRRCEFQKRLTLIIHATNKHRYCQPQTLPLSAVCNCNRRRPCRNHVRPQRPWEHAVR